MVNEGISDIFLEIADLLDLEGVPFKPEAYRRAARALLASSDDVATLIRSGRLAGIRGLGEALTEKVREFAETGKVPYLEKLRTQWPPGLLQLMRLPGIGPKTTRRFFTEFQVASVQDLDRLLKEGKLQGVFGFGPRKIELLQKAVQQALAAPAGASTEARLPLPEAQELADELLAALREAGAPMDRLVFAGSLRRRRETVGDLDLLATTTDPRKVMASFVHLPQVAEVKLSGDTKSTVTLQNGFQVDLRAVPAEAFGAALQYFTGSKDHNIRIRSLANQKGFSVNEYGLTREGKLVPAPTEEEVYAAVGLSWVPPELREDQGEVQEAQAGKLPPLVQDAELRGELHIHVPASVEKEDLAPWTEGLASLGATYGGFVVRAEDLESLGTSAEKLRRSLPRDVGGVRVLLGVELSLEARPPTRPPSGADFLAAPFPDRPVPDAKGWREPLEALAKQAPLLLVHLSDEALTASGLRWREVLEGGALARAVEVAVSHERVPLASSRVREASSAGAPVVLSGWPRVPEELPRLRLAAGIARRGRVITASVLNARADPFAR